MEIEKQIQQYENTKFIKKRSRAVSHCFASFIEGNFKNHEIYVRGKACIRSINKVNQPGIIIKVIYKDTEEKIKVLDKAHARCADSFYIKIKYIDNQNIEVVKYFNMSLIFDTRFFSVDISNNNFIKELISFHIGFNFKSPLELRDLDLDEGNIYLFDFFYIDTMYNMYFKNIFKPGFNKCASCAEFKLDEEYKNNNRTCEDCLLKAKEKRLMRRYNNN